MVNTEWLGNTPRSWQPEALDAVILAFRAGKKSPLVHACTGAGKSIWIAELCARAKGRVLVTTPTQALVTQLGSTISQRLPGEVGRCFQHAWQPGKRIVVSCNASLDKLLAEQREQWACWVADEAHRIEGDGLRSASSKIPRKVACGLTATPFRGDNRGLQTWDEIVYSYSSGQAVRDGVLVPWRAVRWDGSGDPETDDLVEQWVKDADGPGIVSAISIKDAETFAARLGPSVALAIHQRCSPDERERRIRLLKAGKIKCLVHVQLLCEGVDLPWLRWLAMRRPVSSPLRLVQEVGRVLRAAPGKREAVLYDPHDLLGELGLVHAAVLEDSLQREAEESEEVAWSIPELEGLEAVSQLPKPKAVSVISGWITDVLGAFRGAGLADPPGQFEGGGWRYKPASAKQIELLGKLAWVARYLPDERHRRAVRWVAAQPEVLAGTASDLIEILRTMASASAPQRKAHRHWHCPVSIPNVVIPGETE